MRSRRRRRLHVSRVVDVNNQLALVSGRAVTSVVVSAPDASLARYSFTAPPAVAATQELTLVHVRAQLQQLQDTFMS
jgi:hypothetical protein